MVNLEELSDAELDRLHAEFHQLHSRADEERSRRIAEAKKSR
jgi:hypothetical protein